VKKAILYSLAVFSLLLPCRLGAQGQTVQNLFLAFEHVSRGSQYMAMNLWDEAEDEFWQAVALDYNNSKARQGLGDVYRRKQRFEEAIEHYQMVLNNEPNNVDIQYLISLSYYDNHQYEEARVAAEKALQMNPELAKAENLVRLSADEKQKQQIELSVLKQKEEAALKVFLQQQKIKESGFIAAFVPGWRLIQTAEPRTMWTGYAILGSTAGFFLTGYMLRSQGQKAYDQAVEGTNREYYQDRVNVGQAKYKWGGYMLDASLGVFILNMVDSFILHGKIFSGRTRVKPSLPERERRSQ